MTDKTDTALVRTMIPELADPVLRKSERTKFAIVRASVEVYAAHGRDGANYERIAEKAGISRPLVQKYFPDRDELYELAMKFVFANLQKISIDAMGAMGPQAKPSAPLEAYVRSCFRWSEKHRSHACAALASLIACAAQGPMRRMNSVAAIQGIERIQAMLRQLPANKKASAPALAARAKAIQNLLLGAVYSSLTEEVGLTTAEIESQTLSACLALATADLVD